MNTGFTKEHLQLAQVELLNSTEIERCRQWFNSMQDSNPAYIQHADYMLAKKLYQHLGLRVPDSITEGLQLAKKQVKLAQGEARACEIFSLGKWVLHPIDLYEEAVDRGWPVRLLVVQNHEPK